MRREERGEEHDTTMHLIEIKFLPTLVVLLILAQVQLIGPCAQKLESGI